MAEPTKAELEAELASVKEENELLKSAGQHDLSWYAKQNNDLTQEVEQLRAEKKAAEAKEYQAAIDAEVIANDRRTELEKDLVQYNQSEHTRFRLRERPSRLNIFGTPDGPVFDLGVDLSYFNGPVQIEAYVIVEMAQSIGMLTVEQADELKKELADSKAKNESAAILGTELTSGITSLVDKFYTDLGSVVSSGDVPVETESEADTKSNIPDSKSDEADGQANVDNSGEKSDGVSGTTGDAVSKSGNGTQSTIDDILGKL